jgi:hypothetical protein
MLPSAAGAAAAGGRRVEHAGGAELPAGAGRQVRHRGGADCARCDLVSTKALNSKPQKHAGGAELPAGAGRHVQHRGGADCAWCDLMFRQNSGEIVRWPSCICSLVHAVSKNDCPHPSVADVTKASTLLTICSRLLVVLRAPSLLMEASSGSHIVTARKHGSKQQQRVAGCI